MQETMVYDQQDAQQAGIELREFHRFHLPIFSKHACCRLQLMSVETLREFKRLGRTTVLKKHLVIKKKGCVENRRRKGIKIDVLRLRARESSRRAASSLGLDYNPFSYSQHVRERAPIKKSTRHLSEIFLESHQQPVKSCFPCQRYQSCPLL